MGLSETFQTELLALIERHLPEAVAKGEGEWTLPAVDDFVLIVGVTDLDGSGSAVFEAQSDAPRWHHLGLVNASSFSRGWDDG